jgi:hypothetical protein
VKINWLANPFYLYALAFGLVLLVYGWGWTTLYPVLTAPVIGFWLAGIGGMVALGRWWQPRLCYRPTATNSANSLIVSLFLFGYAAEYAYNGGVPLLLILRGADYDYQTFGIPTFHVFLQTAAPFYTVWLFHQWLSSRSRWLLAGWGLLLLQNVLIANRGAMLMTLVACLTVFVQQRGRLSAGSLAGLAGGGLLFFYGFGFLGYSRSFAGQKEPFYELTQTTEAFQTGWVPGEYLWFYLYTSSPLANFQNVVNEAHAVRHNLPAFAGSQLLPDFIYKRVADPVADPDLTEADTYLIAPFLTVGSTYFDPYRRMGWGGAGLLLLALAGLMAGVLTIVGPDSPYRVTVIALLGSMAVFSTFDNMIRFTGLSFQLVYPVLLTLLSRYGLPGGGRFRLIRPAVRVHVSAAGVRVRWRTKPLS